MIPARPLPPLLLTRPGRFAGVSRLRARVVLTGLAVLLIATLSALALPAEALAGTAGGQADVVLYGTIVDNLRHGGRYYSVAADALRAGDFPLKPFFTMRLPTLAVVQGSMPAAGVALLLWSLVLAVVLAWYARLKPAFARSGGVVLALFLLAGGLVAFLQPVIALFHEVWAGLLIALSLAIRRRGRWIEAAAFGLAAALVRETTALYIVLMAAMAWRDGERREAAGWAATLAVLALALALHARAVAEVVRPLDPASPGWLGMLGPGLFVRAIGASTALATLPATSAALLVGLALFGWAGWREPLATRVLATSLAYAALLAVFGRADTFYWALLVAPVLLVGLAFVPDALRDLSHAALNRRRITVRRLAR